MSQLDTDWENLAIECPECHQITFHIQWFDKCYCLNKECNFGFRTSWMDSRAVQLENYRLRMLAKEIIEYRNGTKPKETTQTNNQ
jgi:hypothetical protein